MKLYKNLNCGLQCGVGREESRTELDVEERSVSFQVYLSRWLCCLGRFSQDFLIVSEAWSLEFIRILSLGVPFS